MKSVLEIRNVTAAYGQDQVLNGIDLTLKAGDAVAIIGESGTGKTTLAHAIMGLCEGVVHGSILFKGKDLLSLDKETMRKVRWNNIGLVFQNINNVLNPVYRAIDQVVEPMVEHGLKGKREAWLRAEKILGEVGLAKTRFYLYPHQLSGGEQQRVLLAMALVNNPELLILDEPLAGLDEIAKIQMIPFLLKLNEVNKITLLILTHDIATAVRLSHRLGSLYGGRILELGLSEPVAHLPRHPYTRALIRSYPNMTTSKDLQGIKGRLTRPVSGCPFHPRCTQAIDVCSTQVPPFKDYEGRMVACHRGGVIPLMRAVGLDKEFNGYKAVDSVNLTIYGGETLALVGPSGAGKTTLARMLMRFLQPTRGQIYLEDREVRQDQGFSSRVQMIFQNPGESLSHRMTVLELVSEPLEVAGILSKKERCQKALQLIGEVQLPQDRELIEKYPHELSGGELQRVAIARSLALDPDLVIADEPTSALDPSIQAKVLKLLLHIQENRGLSILFITHYIAVARKISDRIAVMYEGRIVEEGPTSQIITTPKHPCTKAMMVSAPSLQKTEINSLSLRSAVKHPR
jgi:peptide/nickel transport system ATP-binding protein